MPLEIKIDENADRGPLGLATPHEVAKALRRTPGSLAQMRHLGTGPRFIKCGRRVLYRWSDVEEWIADSARLRTGNSRVADESPTRQVANAANERSQNDH